MPHIGFKKEFSLGNLLSIITIVASLFVAWKTLTGTVEANSKEIGHLDARLSRLEDQFELAMTKITDERVEQTKRLSEIGTDLRLLRQAVDRLPLSTPRFTP